MKTRFILGFLLLASAWVVCAQKQNLDTNTAAQIERALKEVDYDAARHREIANKIWNGELKANENGMVRLPAQLASASKYGNVYLTQMQDGRILVLIPTWRGKGSNLRGYLHSQAPFMESDKHKDHYSGKEQAINVNGPSPGSGKSNICEVVILRALDSKTLYVSRSLD